MANIFAAYFVHRKDFLSMERREQFLNIVSSLTSNSETAVKYAEHLEELFDVIVPEKIGKDFCTALENNDYAKAVMYCAKYYRENIKKFGVE